MLLLVPHKAMLSIMATGSIFAKTLKVKKGVAEIIRVGSVTFFW